MSWSPVWTTAAFSALQGAVVYTLFEFWRRQDNKQGIYQPRRLTRPKRTPPAPGPGLFSWVREVSRVNDDETLLLVGMDHYVLLRFMIFGIKLTGGPTILALILMLAVYATGGNGQEEFNKISMSNVEAEGFRLWYSVAFMYIMVLWALFLLWFEWANFVPKRSRFLAEGDPDMNKEVAYTVLVENVPRDERSSPALYRYFDCLFPGKVSYASLCMDAGTLETVLQKKQNALEKIEHVVAQKHLKPDKEHTTRVGGMVFCGGEVVDAESYYRGELDKYLAEAKEEHARISQVASQGAGSAVSSSTGFVAFTSIASKLSAVGLNISGVRFEMDTYNAPSPSDIIWDNVTAPVAFVSTRKLMANCFWSVGILFWSIPVIFVQGIADLDELGKRFSWLWTPDKSSFLYGLIAGLLPVVALAVLTALIPIAIRLVAIKFIRMKSMGEVDLYVFKWHFGFRVANLWLTIIGGSIINQLDPFIEDPSSILDLLGASVPGKAQFFLLTLLVSLLGGLAMDISRIVTVIISYVKGALSDDRGKSDREQREASAPPSLDWGTFYPPLLFVLMVVFVYCSIAPIVLPVAFLLFTGGYFVYKNQALYLYVQKGESGGAAMFVLFSFGMASLYVGEIVFVAFIGIKQGAGQGVWALILIFITMAWHYMVSKKFVSISKVQSLKAAVEADGKVMELASRERPSGTADQPFEGKAYVQSCLKKSEWEVTPEEYRDPANLRKAGHVEPRRENVFERGALGGAV